MKALFITADNLSTLEDLAEIRPLIKRQVYKQLSGSMVGEEQKAFNEGSQPLFRQYFLVGEFQNIYLYQERL